MGKVKKKKRKEKRMSTNDRVKHGLSFCTLFARHETDSMTLSISRCESVLHTRGRVTEGSSGTINIPQFIYLFIYFWSWSWECFVVIKVRQIIYLQALSFLFLPSIWHVNVSDSSLLLSPLSGERYHFPLFVILFLFLFFGFIESQSVPQLLL